MPKYKEVIPSFQTGVGYELIIYKDSNLKPDYLFNGMYHREDGPAYEGIRDDKEWWLNGESLDKDWFLKNPEKINEMKAWELFEPEELVRLKLDKPF